MSGFYRLFTGLCHGGSIEKKYESTIMSCKILDYTKILKDQLFFNSPWFDGVRDVNAVFEILDMAGFRDQGEYDPGALLRKLSPDTKTNPLWSHHCDGRAIRCDRYTLPSGYDRLSQPAFKFKDGDSYYQAITKIAEISSKLFYFDQFGIAHFENYFDIVMEDVLGESGNSQSKTEEIFPLFAFTTSPTNVVGNETYIPIAGQLVFNKMNTNYNVTDVYNHIKILSNTPDMTPIFSDNLEWSSIDDPTVEGFMGYFKTFYQQEGMFGSVENTEKISKFYQTMFKPPLVFNFETYGLPMRALDTITIDNVKSRVMKVTHNLSPKENKWWMTVECETFQKIKEKEETDGQ
jgi:hypothetical protein